MPPLRKKAAAPGKSAAKKSSAKSAAPKRPAPNAAVKKSTAAKAPAKKVVAAKAPARKAPVAKKAAAAKPAAKKSATITKAAPRATAGVLMNATEMARAIEAMAKAIAREFPKPDGLLVLGIRTRGVALAERLRTRLEDVYDADVASGVLDITLYRDDLSGIGPQPMVRDSEIPFDVTGTHVILVDDVLYTGRTIRAAMDEIIDYGRPAHIRLAVLVDRGCREYPIQPDYAGMTVTSTPSQSVRVSLGEIDDRDEVVVKG